MKRKPFIILLIILISMIVSCSRTASTTGELQHAHWLMGTWVTPIPQGPLHETWRAVSASEMSGRSYLVTNGDTTFFESIRLVEEQGKLYYIPTVPDQNNNQPVRFEASAISATELVFENASHDFPQKITYTKVSADSLIAVVSGIQDGHLREERFPMRREPDGPTSH